eukprot:543847-Rhodomonas_salina.2
MPVKLERERGSENLPFVCFAPGRRDGRLASLGFTYTSLGKHLVVVFLRNRGVFGVVRSQDRLLDRLAHNLFDRFDVLIDDTRVRDQTDCEAAEALATEEGADIT